VGAKSRLWTHRSSSDEGCRGLRRGGGRSRGMMSFMAGTEVEGIRNAPAEGPARPQPARGRRSPGLGLPGDSPGHTGWEGAGQGASPASCFGAEELGAGVAPAPPTPCPPHHLRCPCTRTVGSPAGTRRVTRDRGADSMRRTQTLPIGASGTKGTWRPGSHSPGWSGRRPTPGRSSWQSWPRLPHRQAHSFDPCAASQGSCPPPPPWGPRRGGAPGTPTSWSRMGSWVVSSGLRREPNYPSISARPLGPQLAQERGWV
jgi:hypothetical protein